MVHVSKRPRTSDQWPRSAAGSTTTTPAASKSRRLRVTTARSCVSAVAAMKLSLIGIAAADISNNEINGSTFGRNMERAVAQTSRSCKRLFYL